MCAVSTTEAQMRYLRFRDLRARGVFSNRVTLKNWVERYGFPPGHLVGNARMWRESDVEAWIASHPTDWKPAAPALQERLAKARAARRTKTAQAENPSP